MLLDSHICVCPLSLSEAHCCICVCLLVCASVVYVLKFYGDCCWRLLVRLRGRIADFCLRAVLLALNAVGIYRRPFIIRCRFALTLELMRIRAQRVNAYSALATRAYSGTPKSRSSLVTTSNRYLFSAAKGALHEPTGPLQPRHMPSSLPHRSAWLLLLIAHGGGEAAVIITWSAPLPVEVRRPRRVWPASCGRPCGRRSSLANLSPTKMRICMLLFVLCGAPYLSCELYTEVVFNPVAKAASASDMTRGAVWHACHCAIISSGAIAPGCGCKGAIQVVEKPIDECRTRHVSRV